MERRVVLSVHLPVAFAPWYDRWVVPTISEVKGMPSKADFTIVPSRSCSYSKAGAMQGSCLPLS